MRDQLRTGRNTLYVDRQRGGRGEEKLSTVYLLLFFHQNPTLIHSPFLILTAKHILSLHLSFSLPLRHILYLSS